MLDRLQQFWTWLHKPQHVEKASRRERIKRSAWMVISAFAAIGFVLLGSIVLGEFLVRLGSPTTGSQTIFPLIIAITAVDYVIWDWGVDRFNIVVPWQYRDAADDEGTE